MGSKIKLSAYQIIDSDLSWLGVSRTSIVYAMGICPVCGEELNLTVIKTIAAKSACCENLLLYGDEVATCSSSACRVHMHALCLDAKDTCRFSRFSGARSFPGTVDSCSRVGNIWTTSRTSRIRPIRKLR